MKNNYEIIKYESEDVSIDIRYDSINNTIWLTQNEIALIFNVNRQAITRSISKENDGFISSTSSYEEQVQTEGKRKINRKVMLYNLDMIEAISLRSKSNSGYDFIKWVNKLIREKKNINFLSKSPNEAENTTYIKYYSGTLELDVNVSSNKVWLTQEQISALFEKDISVISRHIKNILASGECDKSNLQKMQIPFSDKLVTIYDIDVIISVGYRVSSLRGLKFRQWSRNIVKDYISLGYSINEKRCNECQTNLLSLSNRVEKLEKENLKISDTIFGKEVEFYSNGDVISPLLKISKILFLAKYKIVIVDNYADQTIIKLVENISNKVKIYVITNGTYLNNKEINRIIIIKDNPIHDRYILIDDKYTYRIGTSINSIGKEDTEIDYLKDIEPSYILRNMPKIKAS